jgi:cell division protein FtsL
VSALELHSPTIPSPANLGRFRLVDRRPRPNVRRRQRPMAHPFRAALVYTALPALVLVFYVSLWTTAVHGGYQEQRLTTAIQQLRIDNQALQADVRRLQSPTRIFQQATQLGMQEARPTEYFIQAVAAPAPAP